MHEKIKQFLLALIETKGKLPKNADIDSFNYVDSGYIDSTEVLKFILNVEAEFGVELSDVDRQSSAFKTIGGLANIISQNKPVWNKANLNKVPGRYYWQYLLAQQDTIPKSLFYPTDIALNEKIALFKKYVCIVNIETSTYCNRKCTYCPVSLDNSRKKQRYMANNVFNKILDELSSIDYLSTICCNLYNEPLADEHIYPKISQMRNRLPNAFLLFNSNGDYVNADSLNKLSESGLNALFITLHPSVDKPYEIGDRVKSFQGFFNKIGLDSQHCEISEPLENGHIESNIDWHGMRLRVMANDWFKYGNSRAGAMPFLDTPVERTAPCVRPLREIVICHNGNVFPCCQFFPDSAENQQYVVGNVVSQSLFEIYASHALAKWRKDLFTFDKKLAPCASCADEDFASENSSAVREAILNQLKT